MKTLDLIYAGDASWTEANTMDPPENARPLDAQIVLLSDSHTRHRPAAPTGQERHWMRTILFVLLGAPVAASACGPDQALVFSCPSNQGQVEVCQAQSALIFHSGSESISVPTAKVLWKRDAKPEETTDALHFPGVGEVYHVAVSKPRGDRPLSAEVSLTRSGKIVGTLVCQAGTVTFDAAALKATPKEG